MNLIQGKKILEKYAFTKKTLCKIYNFLFFNRKIIKGKNNQIILPTTFMKKSKIIIKGNNNKIIFGDMCYLINTKISIYGDNNTIIIGEKVYINEGDFYLEDSSNILKIDEHTTFSGNTHRTAPPQYPRQLCNHRRHSNLRHCRSGSASIYRRQLQRTSYPGRSSRTVSAQPFLLFQQIQSCKRHRLQRISQQRANHPRREAASGNQYEHHRNCNKMRL